MNDRVTARPRTGSWVRRTTRRVQAARQGRGAGSVLLEVWSAVVVLAVQAAVLGSAVVLLGEEIATASGGRAPGSDLPGAAAALALAGLVLGVAARLGPAGVGRAGATWWLPLPVDRRGLLRLSVLGWPAAAALAGGLGTPLAVLALGGQPDAAPVIGWAGLGAGLSAVLVAAAGLLQTTSRAHVRTRRLALTGDALMVLGATGAAAALTTGATWRLGATWHVAVPVALLVAAGLVVGAERRAERVDGALLRERSGVADRVRGAVLSLDLRELSRALLTAARRSRRPSRALRARGPRRAVVLADVVLVVRSPRAVLQVLVALALGVSAGTALGAGVLGYLAWVVTGFWAVGALAGGARHTDAAPALERLLPLSRRAVRAVHGVVPGVGGLVWAAGVLGSEASRTATPGWWLVVPAWALVLAAAAVRSAFRPPSRFLAASVTTPMGGVPSTGGLLQGIDVALLGTLPTAYAAIVGTGPTTAVVAVLAAVAVVRLVGRDT